MDITTENEGLEGWYDGFVKKGTTAENYWLRQFGKDAIIHDAELGEVIWKDVHDKGLEVMLNGVLEPDELTTGNDVYRIGYVNDAGVIIEDNYAGHKVGVSGNDLVFMKNDDITVYYHESRDDLVDTMEKWFKDETSNFISELNPVLTSDDWPWTV